MMTFEEITAELAEIDRDATCADCDSVAVVRMPYACDATGENTVLLCPGHFIQFALPVVAAIESGIGAAKCPHCDSVMSTTEELQDHVPAIHL